MNDHYRQNRIMKTDRTRSFTGRIAAVLLLFGIVAVMTGCTTYSSFRNTFFDTGGNEEEKVITIGVFEPMTGRSSQKGNDEIKGIELANSIYNNVDGYKVVLSKIDTKSSVSATETAIQGLIEMKPVAIIGSAGEATSLAASEYIDEAGIPTITPSATNPLITQGTSYYFRASITEAQMGQGLAEYALEELDSTHIGVVTLKNDSSTAAMQEGFDDEVRDTLGKKNRAVVVEREISADEKEMNSVLHKMKSENVDVCFVPLSTENMDMFLTFVENRGMTNITFLGTRSWGEPDFIEMMEKHPDIKVVFPYESVLSGTSSTSDAVTEEAQRFQIEYAAKYGNDDIPTYNAALGYDSYLLLINAIHNAKSTDGKDIRLALLELKDLKCSTGAFSFDSSGNVVRPVSLSTLKDGKPVNEYVTKSDAEFKALEDIEGQEKAAEEAKQVENEPDEEETTDGEEGEDDNESSEY